MSEPEIEAMVEALALEGSPNDMSVRTLELTDLVDRYNLVSQQLKNMGEMMKPKTQLGRDIHSLRGAYLVEMSRRGL